MFDIRRITSAKRRQLIRPTRAAAMAVMAVAGEAGKIVDERVARLGQAIEQRGFADIGPADQD